MASASQQPRPRPAHRPASRVQSHVQSPPPHNLGEASLERTSHSSRPSSFSMMSAEEIIAVSPITPIERGNNSTSSTASTSSSTSSYNVDRRLMTPADSARAQPENEENSTHNGGQSVGKTRSGVNKEFDLDDFEFHLPPGTISSSSRRIARSRERSGISHAASRSSHTTLDSSDLTASLDETQIASLNLAGSISRSSKDDERKESDSSESNRTKEPQAFGGANNITTNVSSSTPGSYSLESSREDAPEAMSVRRNWRNISLGYNDSMSQPQSISAHSYAASYGATSPAPQPIHSGRTITPISSSSSSRLRSHSSAMGDDEQSQRCQGECFGALAIKRRKINLLIDQCENVRFPFKKKLILANMNLSASDVPVDVICSSEALCSSLHKLSLAGNRLMHVPDSLVMQLAGLRTLDLSQCDLRTLPSRWKLPHLKRLDLSHNRLEEFLGESALEGLPELLHLDMYGNKVCEIIVPRNNRLLSKLDHLNLGYNNLAHLPEDLNQLGSLRTLKVMNNVLEKIPEEVCEMELRVLDVSSNPLVQPPIETCERGIASMRRYYACLKVEEDTRQKMLDSARQKKIISEPVSLKKLFIKNKKPSLFGRREKSISSKGSSSQTPPLGRTASAPEPSPSTPHPPLSRLDKGQTEASRNIRHANVRQETSSPGPSVSSSLSHSTPEVERSSLPHTRSTSLPIEMERKEVSVSLPGVLEELPSVDPLSPSSLGTPIVNKEPVHTEESSNDLSSRDAIVRAVEVVSPANNAAATSLPPNNGITINDTLKVIFVGMACAGKTSMIKRLLEGKDAKIPKLEERTVGVDIYEWDPLAYKGGADRDHVNTKIQLEEEMSDSIRGGDDVKFSVWDFAGQHVYHATHELFFSPRALYVLVWDMGATNKNTQRRRPVEEEDHGAFKLSYDSSDDEEDDPFWSDDEVRRADRALERDIDEKVQFWVDCIQSSAPGAAILPVASFNDYFDNAEGPDEAKRRCNLMKQRLLKHEERRKLGIQERLDELVKGHRPNSSDALRLRHLLCSYSRPKLIFGPEDDDSVVRVSGTKYTGFDRLSAKIVNIATGRDQGNWRYPIFRGHIGARIPRMRLQVRNVVREMRDRFKVVEWGYFLNELKIRGINNDDDVSDALHFLTNVGELSYFGDVAKSYHGPKATDEVGPMERHDSEGSMEIEPLKVPASDDDEDDDDEQDAVLAMDEETRGMLSRGSSSEASAFGNEPQTSGGLSQFVFLNPRWLVAAVACILRHDLSREINETRRALNLTALPGLDNDVLRGNSFYDVHLNCPVITAEDACMLWQTKKITKKAAERAQEHSNNTSITPFDFLQQLLARFGVFVPIDLTIDKAFLGGKEYGRFGEAIKPEDDSALDVYAKDFQDGCKSPHFFFLPSLLGPGEPAEAWTYKNSDSWKTTLCHSLLFPDGVPPGLMERITAAVLADIYAATHSTDPSINQRQEQDQSVPLPQSMNMEVHLRHQSQKAGRLHVKEILCWRSAFYLKLGMEVNAANGAVRESIVEIFTHLVDRDSHLCVASDSMGVGMRRLVLSGKGQVGDGGRKIWQGGYSLVAKAIMRVAEEYGGLEYEKQGVCPECLAKRAISQASAWEWSLVHAAANAGDETLRCHNGHQVDTRLVAGCCEPLLRKLEAASERPKLAQSESTVPVSNILRGVVVVGLWDGKSQKVVRVGSGFIADKKRGLIITASHTLMNIWGDGSNSFGENYYGLREGKVVIGVIPRSKDNCNVDETTAVFRYFAKIVAKDENIEKNRVCHTDACVLQITTKLEQDVGGDGDGCGEQPEILLLNNTDALKKEKLHQLKVSNKESELDEQVRILGYNQGGEGLLQPGMHVNRCVDFARGYVVMKFHTDANDGLMSRRFKPNKEVVVICPTIGGHSGGPCVNQAGEVIGILSRADPTEKQRCYLVPASEWKFLLKKAKNSLF